MQRLLFRSFPFSSRTLAWAWSGQRIFCPFLFFPALPIIILPEAEYFWICECLQALCSSTACASLTSCFRSKWRPYIWLVMLRSPLRPVEPQIVEKKFLIGIGSTHYLFTWCWIFLDLWVSSSALLLNCMCFFDFICMFPFQVTAFDTWLLPPQRQWSQQ